jgi:YVTN family beta-propeller protein
MKNLTSKFNRALVYAILAALTVAVALRAGVLQADDATEKPGWLGPCAVATSADGHRAFVALADAKQVIAIDPEQGTVLGKADVPGEPTALAIDAKSGRLYVSCAGVTSIVAVLDSNTMQIVQSLPVGHTATGLALTPDGSRLFVCNRFNNDVSVLSLSDGKEIARVKVAREPVGVAITPDGKTAYVINLLPTGPADRDDSSSAVTTIDVASLSTGEVRLPNGSSSVRGICLSPDGKYVFVTHVLSRNALPATQLERGWMNTNALSILDAAEKKMVATVLLDDVDLGAANPWGVGCSQDGATLCIAHSGTHEASLIDLKGLFAKLASRAESLRTVTEVHAPASPALTSNVAAKWDTSVLSLPLESTNDLSFLVGLRRRVALSGNGPRGLAIAGDKALIAMYYSDNLAVVNLAQNGQNAPVAVAKTIPLGPAPQMTEVRRGEKLFHDATACFQHWQSCTTCHPDARSDALNWDLMNDGHGNPKNSKSMLFSHRTPPAMSESVRESAEMAVRAGFRGILFMACPEDDVKAVDAYLKSLQPVPSPHLVQGALSPSAQRGKALFFSKRIGCSECHPEPLFTNLKPHNVGSRASFDQTSSFDTPTLIEAWRTAPYLHDGSCPTIEDLIGKRKHGKEIGEVESLSPQEIADLVEYVLSL